MKKRSGFTLVELITVIVLVAVVAAVAATVFLSLMRVFVLVPRETRVCSLAGQIQDVILEGDAAGGGLRFARSLTSIAADQMTYAWTDENGQTNAITIRWDQAGEKMYRRLKTTGPSAMIPYNLGSDIKVRKRASAAAVFSYLDENGRAAALPSTVRRVEVNLTVRTGSGDFSAWESSFDLSSGMDIKQY